ncbi:MAG TPA: ornithine cyclodeaminase family protein [Caldimonas sp.]|jgi:ornithine cyclodeaminase|nr:ornithine cyclodeaminase family protein [Caldimonas sp.]
MRFYGADETRERLAFAPLIDALRTMFERGCELPPRQVLELAGAGDDAVTSLVMPAWQRGGCYGVKVVNVAPGNAARGLPGLHSTYVLYDAGTGAPLAWIDGDELTARRTAATSALAASWLAREGASHLAVIGAGRIARLLPEAHRAVRPIERVTVWARSTPRAAALVAELAGEGFDARVAASAEAAVAEAEIVSCATLAREPVVSGRWLRTGSHLDLIGSFAPAMREADDACFAAAAVFVDSDDAATKSGDLIGPIARGVVAADAIGTLAELARGRRDGRRSPGQQRTVFKSVGSALEDLAAATLVHGAAPAPSRSRAPASSR